MPKNLEWSSELISKFWDGIGEIPSLEALSFARLNGPVILEFMRAWIKRGDRCLDFGGGGGDLAELMVKADLRVACFEPSGKRARLIEDRLGFNPDFLGVVRIPQSETFDFVICTEVIEHVPISETDHFLRSLTKHIVRSGRVLLTTPHAEILDNGQVYCPCCDHVFHRWQHQRSWQIEEIQELFECRGFKTLWLGAVSFNDPAPVRDFTLRMSLQEQWPWTMAVPSGRRFPKIGKGEHIVYVGEKQ